MTPVAIEQIEAAFARASGAFVRALRDAAIAQGLDAEASDRIARQTILGSVELLRTSGESAAELTKRVASAGGTTEAGLKVMNAADGIDAIVASMISATPML